MNIHPYMFACFNVSNPPEHACTIMIGLEPVQTSGLWQRHHCAATICCRFRLSNNVIL